MRRSCGRSVFTLIACLWASVLPLAAQVRSESLDRPMEIGIQGGAEASQISSGGDLRLTVTVPRGEGRSIEYFVGGYRGTDGFNIGVYGFQVVRQMAWRPRPAVQPFATFGLMGAFDSYETRSCTDASCGSRESFTFLPPILGLMGLGIQYTATPRVAVRLESQAALLLFVPVGVRVSAGVSVPLGRTTFQRGRR